MTTKKNNQLLPIPTNKPKQKQLGKTKSDLKRRAQIIAKEIINGSALTPALKAAGYSESYANSAQIPIMDNPKIQRTFTQILEKAGLSDDYLAKRIKELAEAKDKKFFVIADKIVEKEVKALSIQADMVKFGTKLRGHVTDQVEHSGNLSMMQMVIAHFSGDKKEDEK